MFAKGSYVVTKKGYFFCFVGPAGAGKSSLTRFLLREHSSDLVLAISATSRAPRPGEVEGEHYFFLSREEFMARVESGEFFEWEETHGNLYGTPQHWIRRVVEDGKHVLLDVDVRGALSFYQNFPSHLRGVLVLPPSVADIIERVTLRGGVSSEEMNTRLGTMKRELSDFEKAIDAGVFQCWILNNTREQSKRDAECIYQGNLTQELLDMRAAREQLKKLSEEVSQVSL
jgi:guanylate kinase